MSIQYCARCKGTGYYDNEPCCDPRVLCDNCGRDMTDEPHTDGLTPHEEHICQVCGWEGDDEQ